MITEGRLRHRLIALRDRRRNIGRRRDAARFLDGLDEDIAVHELARFGLLAKAFCAEHGEFAKTSTRWLEYGTSLQDDAEKAAVEFEKLLEAARALDGKERT